MDTMKIEDQEYKRELLSVLGRIASALEKKSQWRGKPYTANTPAPLPPPKEIEEYKNVPEYLIAIGYQEKTWPTGGKYYNRKDERIYVTVQEKEEGWWAMSFFCKTQDPQKWYWKLGQEGGEIYDNIMRNVMALDARDKIGG